MQHSKNFDVVKVQKGRAGPSDLREAIATPATLEIPPWEEIFDRPPDPVTPIDYPDTLAFELVDREFVRLGVNCCFDPPVLEEEIARHARRFGLTPRQAELEIRRSRDAF